MEPCVFDDGSALGTRPNYDDQLWANENRVFPQSDRTLAHESNAFYRPDQLSRSDRPLDHEIRVFSDPVHEQVHFGLIPRTMVRDGD